MGRVVIWGAGELGGRVATQWVAAGGRALGCTRTERRHGALRQAGVVPRTGGPTAVLEPDDRLLLALAGSAAQGDAIQSLIDAGVAPPERAVLISSTGYYGRTAGGAIRIDTPAGPGARAQRVAQTEALFRQWAGDRGVVLRCAGLYRQGRGPLSALQTRGEAPPGPPDKTLALVHYDDAATATVAALRHPEPEPTYLVVSPPLPTRQQFYLAACVLLELPLPRFEPPLGVPPAAYDLATLRRDLLPEPAHARWQEALVP